MMLKLFKKRQDEDLRRLISAYRCMRKAALQAESHGLLDERQRENRKWKGGFGKAVQLLFKEWPTPNESRRFDKMMQRWLRKAKETDQAFVLAFNEYLGQKRLSNEELKEILVMVRPEGFEPPTF